MEGWVKHQTGRKTVPKLVYGRGEANERPAEQDANFTLDKSGLFLPEGVASERRKVKTGFQPSEEA